MHLVVDVFPLWVEFLEDLCEDVDCLLTAQSSAFSLELLQQVFSGHGLPDQITAHSLLRQLHVTESETGRATREEVSIVIIITINRSDPHPCGSNRNVRRYLELELGVDFPDAGCGVLFPDGL